MADPKSKHAKHAKHHPHKQKNLVRHHVPLIAQHNTEMCWEAVGHMMYGFKYGNDLKQYHKAMGKWRNDEGMSPDSGAFLMHLGMVEGRSSLVTDSFVARRPFVSGFYIDRAVNLFHLVVVVGVDHGHKTYQFNNPCESVRNTYECIAGVMTTPVANYHESKIPTIYYYQ